MYSAVRLARDKSLLYRTSHCRASFFNRCAEKLRLPLAFLIEWNIRLSLHAASLVQLFRYTVSNKS